MKAYFLVCFVAGLLLCIFVASMIVFKANHPINNAKPILVLLVMLAAFVRAAAEMLQAYREEKRPN